MKILFLGNICSLLIVYFFCIFSPKTHALESEEQGWRMGMERCEEMQQETREVIEQEMKYQRWIVLGTMGLASTLTYGLYIYSPESFHSLYHLLPLISIPLHFLPKVGIHIFPKISIHCFPKKTIYLYSRENDHECL